MENTYRVPVRILSAREDLPAQAPRPVSTTTPEVDDLSWNSDEALPTESDASSGPSLQEPLLEDLSVESLYKENIMLKSKLKETYKDLLRIQEHRNTELQQARQEAEESALNALIPALAALLRAEQQFSENEAVSNGMNMVFMEIEKQLASMGFDRIPDVGVLFDPVCHEAAGVMQLPGVAAGRVAALLSPGYSREGRTVVAAKVMVSRPGGEQES